MSSLFAEAPDLMKLLPWEVLIPSLAGLLGAAGGFGWWVARRNYKGRVKNLAHHVDVLKDQIAHLQDDRRDDQKTITRLRKEADEERGRVADRDARLGEAKKKLLPVYHAYVKLKPVYDQLVKDHATAQDLVKKLTTDAEGRDGQLKTIREQLEKREAELNRTDRRIRKALRLEGNLWTVRALQKVPKFRPLGDRNRAVISVLNLKGGVGKTTVTAHLGMALARRGYRVLLVDLDLQGSLSSLFLEYDKLQQLSADERLVQHFLRAASADLTTKVADYAVQVLAFPESGGRVGLVPASDHLAYAELSLTLRWLLRQGERDARFLLRKALHLKAVDQGYDIVLLDCPPLVNISCVNALAASDYVLVPATLGRRALERVPVLIRRFLCSEPFQKNINHDLKLLGLLANRTVKDQLGGPEQAAWRQLGVWCQDAAGQEVKSFRAVIPQQTKELRDAETEFAVPDPGSKLAQVFAALADEVERELPHGCRRAAKAPV
jgi:cellulose biosynthesis protein BcsQ/chaperonin cofactor prefoldin